MLLLATEAPAHPAWGIAVGRDREIYFSDLVNVWKIDPRGKLILFRRGEETHTHDLAIDEEGNLYGAENSYEPATQRFFSAIWKMTPTGEFTYLLPRTDDPPEGISVWRDREGNTYHATRFPEEELLLLKRSPLGAVTVLTGDSSRAREYRQGVPYGLGGMGFGADGSLFFVHGASVGKLGGNGVVTALAPDIPKEPESGDTAGAGAPTQLFGLAVDARGDAAVADYGSRRVIRIAPDGNPSTLLRAEEPWHPTGVAAGGEDLYVLEIGHTSDHTPIGTRVRRLSPDGSVTVLAMIDAAGAPSNRRQPDTASRGARPARSGDAGAYLPYAAAAVAGLALLLLRRARERKKRPGRKSRT